MKTVKEKQTLDKLRTQWENRTNSVDCFEFELVNGEFVIVYVTCSFEPYKKGVFFSVNGRYEKTYFSGNVKKRGGGWFYPFDLVYGSDSIDWYLQEVYQEVLEGCLIPNNLQIKE